MDESKRQVEGEGRGLGERMWGRAECKRKESGVTLDFCLRLVKGRAIHLNRKHRQNSNLWVKIAQF